MKFWAGYFLTMLAMLCFVADLLALAAWAAFLVDSASPVAGLPLWAKVVLRIVGLVMAPLIFSYGMVPAMYFKAWADDCYE